MSFDYLGLFMVLGVGQNILYVYLPDWLLFFCWQDVLFVLYRCRVMGRRDFGPGPASVFLFIFVLCTTR